MEELTETTAEQISAREETPVTEPLTEPTAVPETAQETDPEQTPAPVPDTEAEERDAAFRERVARELAEIHSMDPRICGVEDLGRMERFPEFRAYVDRGYSFLDAYKLAHFDALRQITAGAAAQAVRNAAGKAHLQRTEARGSDGERVPEDVLEQYRIFNPKATDAEILAHYNKSLNH